MSALCCLFLTLLHLVHSQDDPTIIFRTTTTPPTPSTIVLNSDQVTFLRRYVNQRFGLSSAQELPGCRSPSTTTGLCIPKLVRMAFHSCVGNCTGCINLDTQSDNAGLSDIATFLNQVYLTDMQLPDGSTWISVPSLMTRADFWAFSGNEAIIQAAKHQPGPTPPQPTLNFSWGRKDCSPVTYMRTDINPFPLGDGSCSDALAIFRTMGLRDDQAAALIGGGHSMGEAHPENSAYSGTWAPNLAAFSNSLFVFITESDSVGYTHNLGARSVTNGLFHRKWQFAGNRFPALLLDTDACLFLEVGTVQVGFSERGM
eukprot:TRINITY_DN11218_c0_g1_i1.p1 TRINITY_DN11218_c0_g1~~TRINITY_DN11218_c0_g1_i1.p1  ORF type:complete len:345 (+),score=36.68 TRINITY_DN11218_c0_g1_i1:94-1035(+)